MGVVAFRETELASFDWDQLVTLRLAINVQLGSNDSENITLLGAVHEETDGTRWRLYSDLGIKPIHGARLAVLAAKFPAIPEKWTDTIPFWIMKDSVVEYVAGDLVNPDFDSMPEGSDPHEWAVSLQANVPAWVWVGGSPPNWLSPVTTE